MKYLHIIFLQTNHLGRLPAEDADLLTVPKKILSSTSDEILYVIRVSALLTVCKAYYTAQGLKRCTITALTQGMSNLMLLWAMKCLILDF